jgi:hypothetical protein
VPGTCRSAGTGRRGYTTRWCGGRFGFHPDPNLNLSDFGFGKHNFGFVQNRNLVLNHRFGRLRGFD